MLLAVCFHAVITSALLLLLLLKVFHALAAALSIYQQLCTFGVSQLPMAMQSRFRTALCAGTKHEACTATEWQQRVQSESGKRRIVNEGERNVRKECERLQIKLLVTEQLAKNISSLSHSLCLSLFAQVAAKCCRPSA